MMGFLDIQAHLMNKLLLSLDIFVSIKSLIVYLLRQLICNRPADFVIGPRGPITKSVIGPRGPITDFVWFYMERSEENLYYCKV